MISSSIRRIITVLYLLVLFAYVIAGVSSVSFHGDEAMQIYMSSDYATAFIDHAPDRLLSYPPFDIDSDQHLRLINGTVNRYLIGLSWHAAGYTRDSLPPRPGWDWGLGYPDNVSTGHRPDEFFMVVSRLSSAVLTGLGVLLMFGIGWQIGGVPLAYVASFLYAVNPAILLNGRRAMQEGSMFGFGLLTVFAAVLIVNHLIRQNGDNPNGRDISRPYRRILNWILLTIGGALTLASKHTGAVFVIGAYLWVLIAAWQGTSLSNLLRDLRANLIRILPLILCGVITLVLFVALSPALWSDPVARFGDLLKARTELLAVQVTVDPRAPLPFDQRVLEIIRQPFIAPVQHFEVAFWGEIPEIQAEIVAYMASPLSGLQLGVIGGGGLTLLTGVGLIVALRKRETVGLALWFLFVGVSLLANPLPWQRYYLPLMPPAILLASLGITYLARRLRAGSAVTASPLQLGDLA